MEIKGLRRSVHNVNPYVPGKTIGEVEKEYQLKKVIKLGSNENSYGPFPNAIKAMENEIKSLNSYPDTNFNELKEVIANKLVVEASYIAVSHGSGGMLQTLAQTFIEEGDEVIIPLQTYGLYNEISKLMGGTIKKVPLTKDYKIDLDRIRNELTPATKLIWISNPNNPTGTLFDLDAYERLLNALPESTWLILDEAYAEFASSDLLPNTMDHIKEGKNIITVRTFSKAYGLAGARMGYAIANPKMISIIDTVSEPFNANRVALAGAIATLKMDEIYFQNCLDSIVKDRYLITNSLRKMGFDVVDTHTNFIFFTTPYDAENLSQTLLERGIIVRPCTGWNYPNAIRLTIGKSDENQEFLKVFKEIIYRKENQ